MIDLPPVFNPPVAYEPVAPEQDELLEDVAKDAMRQDDVWVLKEDIDAEALGKFWDDALDELKQPDIAS